MSSKQQGKAGVVLLIIVVLIVFLASLAISSSWNTDEYTPIVAQAESDNKVNTTKSEEIEVPIPISDSSDKGKYFLVSKESNHNGFIVIYKRIGVEQTDIR
ncbi:hypothetical protein [Acinetobacter seifertii]|uniref:hypothetical protein n=1 Tax=Acinetobacter seifertii TaxID=1530123 RepID=UPI003AF597EF